ncbi:hypothetical protein F8S13_17710 [Chloroflexia bacterium SDU3-3]|nr:hypothetical protein F8S13_17710 [Chloroflexia bacterium SDU3-3]
MSKAMKNPRKYSACFGRITLLIALLLCASCQRDYGAKGSLRGHDFFLLQFPQQGERQELLSVANDGAAIRTYKAPRYNLLQQTQLPDATWQELVALQQRWCAESSQGAMRTPDPAKISVLFQCSSLSLNSPMYYFTPAELPAVVQQVIAIVPLEE